MLQTFLASWHQQHHARLVDFAGWEMPIQYDSIITEHQAVRQQAGLFDISHMGRLQISGSNAINFLNYVLSVDVSKMMPARIRYALAMNEQGGIKDDILLYHRGDHYLAVVNASNRVKIVEYWSSLLETFGDVTLNDQTFETSMIAIQGPLAAEMLSSRFQTLPALKYYRSELISYPDHEEKFLFSRTGYTGEDGFEVIGSHEPIHELWLELLKNQDHLTVCGLGCRDTLRLEAGMPLYGHELSENIDPISAELQFALAMNKGQFLGQQALQSISEQGTAQTRIGLQLQGRRIAREGTPIETLSGEPVGTVTSGTFSPTLKLSIAMGYVSKSIMSSEMALNVILRGRPETAKVVELPFYRRERS